MWREMWRRMWRGIVAGDVAEVVLCEQGPRAAASTLSTAVFPSLSAATTTTAAAVPAATSMTPSLIAPALTAPGPHRPRPSPPPALPPSALHQVLALQERLQQLEAERLGDERRRAREGLRRGAVDLTLQ